MTSTNKDEEETALNVMGGITSSHDGTKRTKRRRFIKKKETVQIDSLYEKVMSGSRLDLARAITLIESIRSEIKHTLKHYYKRRSLIQEKVSELG